MKLSKSWNLFSLWYQNVMDIFSFFWNSRIFTINHFYVRFQKKVQDIIVKKKSLKCFKILATLWYFFYLCIFHTSCLSFYTHWPWLYAMAQKNYAVTSSDKVWPGSKHLLHQNEHKKVTKKSSKNCDDCHFDYPP